VTRKRLYLEAIEAILARSHKVLIDSKAGSSNGNLIYLPLDKLLDRAAKEPEPATDLSARGTAAGDSDTATVDGRSRTDR
jgi:hypothetical protein